VTAPRESPQDDFWLKDYHYPRSPSSEREIFEQHQCSVDTALAFPGKVEAPAVEPTQPVRISPYVPGAEHSPKAHHQEFMTQKAASDVDFYSHRLADLHSEVRQSEGDLHLRCNTLAYEDHMLHHEKTFHTFEDAMHKQHTMDKAAFHSRQGALSGITSLPSGTPYAASTGGVALSPAQKILQSRAAPNKPSEPTE